MPDVNMMTGTPGAGGTGTTPAPADAGNGAGTGQPDNGEPKDWAKEYESLEARYKESSAEGIRLSKEIKAREDAIIAEKARAANLEKELKEIDEIAKGANPQGYDAHQMRKQYETISTELASIKEVGALDTFTAANPDAAQHREALRDLGRAFPGKDYQTLWTTHFGPVIEANKVLAGQKKARGSAAADDGRGTSTGEPAGKGTIGGYTSEQFNKLPLEKRRDILKKEGIHEVVSAD